MKSELTQESGIRRKIPVIILSWLMVLLWMTFIFHLSSQTAVQSDGLSKSIAKAIVKNDEQVNDVQTKKHYESVVIELNSKLREYAHASVFLVLGFLVANALKRSGLKGFKTFSISFVICAIYALSDEIHQLYVPGRACELIDFLLDCMGALLGLIFYSFYQRIGKKDATYSA